MCASDEALCVHRGLLLLHWSHAAAAGNQISIQAYLHNIGMLLLLGLHCVVVASKIAAAVVHVVVATRSC